MAGSGKHAVEELLDASFISASVGAALELGLFWLIDERAMTAEEVAARLDVQPGPCVYWLQLLQQAGYVEKDPDGYRSSAHAHDAIVRTYQPSTWAFLAQEARERMPVLLDLPTALRRADRGQKRLDYVTLMQASPERARRFTRMLYELHRESADALADTLVLTGVKRVIDIAGGSGVVSMALADRHPELSAVVVDIPNVCAAGRELARERGLADRISYHDADVNSDELPAGFDLALMCDVGLYSPAVFGRIATALMAGARIVVADVFAPATGTAPRSRAHWALERALTGTECLFTAADVERMLAVAGFDIGPRSHLAQNDGGETTTVTASVRLREGG